MSAITHTMSGWKAHLERAIARESPLHSKSRRTRAQPDCPLVQKADTPIDAIEIAHDLNCFEDFSLL
jgi:hypothetical protein